LLGALTRALDCFASLAMTPIQLSNSLTRWFVATRHRPVFIPAPGHAGRFAGFSSSRTRRIVSSKRPKGRAERRALWLPAAPARLKVISKRTEDFAPVHSRLHACAPRATD
jgi:hypothetical protein